MNRNVSYLYISAVDSEIISELDKSLILFFLVCRCFLIGWIIFFSSCSGGGGNFVLSTSLVGYTNVHGAVVPMIHDGYGFFYRIRDDR